MNSLLDTFATICVVMVIIGITSSLFYGGLWLFIKTVKFYLIAFRRWDCFLIAFNKAVWNKEEAMKAGVKFE